jgi:MoxR-like ATPase
MNPDIQSVLAAIDGIVLGKPREVRLTLACVLARGHLLIEDVPGVGKTTLAHAFARVLGLAFHRIQFTSDLLPADIIGVSVYDREQGRFDFHPGPVFSQVVLADEVNRATPKAQSALLEAMEEQQVTVDGQTRALPAPFFVIATQNPSNQVGTYPLPESQLDRFLMRIHLGYPDAKAERALLGGETRRSIIDATTPVLDTDRLLALQAAARTVHAAPALLDYVQALLTHSRQSPAFGSGLSPRAGLSLLAAARAWALIEGRNAVLPEDIQAVLPGVAGHRLTPPDGAASGGDALVRRLVDDVALP